VILCDRPQKSTIAPMMWISGMKRFSFLVGHLSIHYPKHPRVERSLMTMGKSGGDRKSPGISGKLQLWKKSAWQFWVSWFSMIWKGRLTS